jgi:fermentation-respiration switch protein FrsA (DUF1100 family)
MTTKSQVAKKALGRATRYALTRGLLITLGVYIVVLSYLYSVQAAIIFPGRQSQGQSWAQARPPRGAELVRLTAAGGGEIVALFGPALAPDGTPRADAAGRPTVLFFYGNGDCLRNMVDQFEDFRRLGANVLIPDYAGYGMSGGEASEIGCYATADAAYEHLRARPDVDPARIVAGGWSLGAAVAADLASREPVVGLVLFSAFTSMSDMARRFYPFLPGLNLAVAHRFESEKKIARVTCPILLGHGRTDSMIPYAMADRLAAAAGGPVTRFSVDGDHNEFFSRGGDQVLATLGEFLDKTQNPL